MTSLIAVDRLEIQILVDNVTDGLSSTPAFVEGEWSYQWRRGNRLMSGKCLCCAAHGLACLITAHRGRDSRTLLFDTGPEDIVFERNVERLGADLSPVGAIVLSHGHWDHSGAMLRALNMMSACNGGRRVPTYVHPGMFRSRAMKMPGGEMRPMEDVPSIAALTEQGANVVSTAEAAYPLGGYFQVSGEIPRVSAFETGMPGQHRRTEDGQGWEPDPLLMDERFVAVNVAGKGLVVFTACSHAGVVNVLTEARRMHPGVPIHMVLGGLHLSGTNERIIPQTVEAMKGFGLSVIAAGHCTGWRAMTALANAFGDEVLAPLAVGKRFTI